MRKTTLFAAAIVALVLTGVSVSGTLAGTADTRVVPSSWTGFTVLGAMIAIFVLEIV
jgi:hypothetical protein